MTTVRPDTTSIPLIFPVHLPVSESDGRVHWGHDDVLALVARVKDHWHEFAEGMRKKKSIWSDIARELTQDGFYVKGLDCDRKWRNLKIRYMAVMEKQLVGDKTPHRIDYFESIHEVLKDDPDTLAFLDQKQRMPHSSKLKHKNAEDEFSEFLSDGKSDWSDKTVEMLLDVLLEFRDWFTGRESEQDNPAIWQAVSEQLKAEGHEPDPEQCQRQWNYMVNTFHRRQASGESNHWQYSARVQELLAQGIPHTVEPIAPPVKRKAKGTRGRPRKVQRTVKQEVPDHDDFMNDDHESAEVVTGGRHRMATRGSIEAGQIQEVCERLSRVEDSMAISRRLDNLETRLDQMSRLQETHHQTNSLLTQVLSELSRLADALSHQASHSQDPSDMNSPITIVVPHSQHLP